MRSAEQEIEEHGTSVEEIVEGYGTPVYVFFKDKVIERYRIFKETAQRYFNSFLIAYSYKANRFREICSIFKDLSAGADVVSGIELDVAEKIGLPPDRIIFNSPHKTDEEIRRSIKIGIGSLNIDSAEELSHVESIVERSGGKLNVGVRVRPREEVSVQGFSVPRQFGVDYEDLPRIARRIISNGGLNFTQLHSHIGTQVQKVEAFKKEAVLLEKSASLLEKSGIDVETLNFGGGYPLEETPDLFSEEVPSLDDVMKALRSGVERERHFIFEPGRYLVGPAALMLTKVVSVKRGFRGGQTVVVDTSILFLNSASYVRHRIEPVGVEGREEETDVYGSSCTSVDVLGVGVNLPKLKEGDILAIRDCGAYTVFLSPVLHRERPKSLLVERGNIKVMEE